jgi:hypothetical protein
VRGLDVLRQLWTRDAPPRPAPQVDINQFIGQWLSPGLPRQPHFSNVPPRYYDYTTGINYDGTPRSEFPNITSFSQLWGFSKAAMTPRTCISFRSRQITGVPWEIIGRKDYGQVDPARVRRATRLMEKPDVTQGWNFEQ